jgi:hypothetical protein
MSFNSLRNNIDKKISNLTNQFDNITDELEDSVTQFTSQVRLGGDTVIGSVFEEITDSAQNVFNGVISALNLSPFPGPVLPFLPGSQGGSNGTGTPGTAGPWPNDLEPYASYNTIFTLSVLTPREVNFPDQTYRVTDPQNVILRSGGTAGSKKVTTSYESSGGSLEYYIDDVQIESYIAPNGSTGIANGVGVNFTVREPYSLGLFLQTLTIAARQAGYENYIEAPLLLKIEFVGWDEDNNTGLAPYTTRMIPISLVNATVEADEGGSFYQVEAYALNDIAFVDEIQTLRHNVSITGKDLLEICQTGVESLATMINEPIFENEKRGQEEKGDRYVIMFPERLASQSLTSSTIETGRATTSRDSEESARILYSQRTTTDGEEAAPDDFLSTLDDFFELYTGSNISELLKTEAESNVSEIGRKKMIDNFIRPGEMPYAIPQFTYDDDRGVFLRTNLDLQISEDRRKFQFKAGNKIEHVIQQLIIFSEFGKDLVEQLNNVPEDGLIDWFRIESFVYLNPDKNQVAKMGDMPKVYVYRIVPYKVLHSFFSGPARPTKGISNLKSQIAKEYNYIYTGQNKDIIEFKLEFNYAFYTNLMADLGNTSAGSRTGFSTQALASDEPVAEINPEGGTINPEGEVRVQLTEGQTIKQGATGTPEELPKTRIARQAHDAFLNSDVDLLELQLVIMGDPFYIPDSGVGNYVAPDISGIFNMKKGGSINYQNGEVDVNLIFRTPIDYNENGTMDFVEPRQSDTEVIDGFSGLYKVIEVTHNWNQNYFTQTLRLLRRRGQQPAEQQSTGVLKTADNKEKSSNSDDPKSRIV